MCAITTYSRKENEIDCTAKFCSEGVKLLLTFMDMCCQMNIMTHLCILPTTYGCVRNVHTHFGGQRAFVQ